jgi:hypothetical protein
MHSTHLRARLNRWPAFRHLGSWSMSATRRRTLAASACSSSPWAQVEPDFPTPHGERAGDHMHTTTDRPTVSADAAPPAVALLRMMTGYWQAQAIYVAAKLGIADLLGEGPLSAESVASRTGSAASSRPPPGTTRRQRASSGRRKYCANGSDCPSHGIIRGTNTPWRPAARRWATRDCLPYGRSAGNRGWRPR